MHLCLWVWDMYREYRTARTKTELQGRRLRDWASWQLRFLLSRDQKPERDTSCQDLDLVGDTFCYDTVVLIFRYLSVFLKVNYLIVVLLSFMFFLSALLALSAGFHMQPIAIVATEILSRTRHLRQTTL